MSYATQAAGTVHSVTVEMRVASGSFAVALSSAPGATYPLVGLTSVGSQLDPLSTRKSLAGVEVTLANTAAVQNLLAPEYSVQVFLFEEASQSQTTLKVRLGDGAKLTAALGAVPFDLHVGAETVTVTNIAGAADHDLLTVTRAAGVGDYISDPFGHAIGTPCGASPQSWVGRIVKEYLIYPNGDEKLAAMYAVDGIPSYRDGAWSLPMQDALGFYNRPIGRGLGPVRIVDGETYLAGGNLNEQGLLLAGDRFASLDTIPNRYHMVPSVFVSGDLIATSVQRQGNANGLQYTAAGQPNAYLFPYVGQSGWIIKDRDGNNGQRFGIGAELDPRIVVRGRADFVVLRLLNSVTGDGTNGAWDILPGNASAQIGAGVPAGRINDAEITRLLQSIDDFEISIKPGDLLLDVLERELALLDLFVDIDTDGLVTVRQIHYAITTQNCDHQLTDASALASASEELRVGGRIVTRLELKGGFDIIDEEHRLTVNMPGVNTAENNDGDVYSFEPTWVRQPTSLEELEVLEENLGNILGRWNVPRPEFALEHDWTKHQVRVGDTAAVINARLPDGTGGQGVSVATLVTATESDLEAGLVRITAEVVGNSRGGYFCPGGEIQAVAALGGGQYLLTLNAAAASRMVSGLQAGAADADENEYFAAGWAVHGYHYATGVVNWTGEVVSIGAGAQITVTATAAPQVDEIMTPRDYGTFGSAASTQPPLTDLPGNRRPGLVPIDTVAYLWLADAANTLGATADPAREWI